MEEDLQGWEVVPDDGFLEIQDEDDGKKIFSRKFGIGPNNVFKNYFICPSPKPSSQFVDSTTTELSRVPKQLVPIHLEPPADDDDDQEFLKQLARAHPVQISISPSPIPEKIGPPPIGVATEADQDPVSQVSFKKKKEPEFVEMKMDSPRSNNNSRGIKSQSQIDAGMIQFDGGYKGDSLMSEALESKISSPKFKAGEEQTISNDMDPEVKKEVITWEEENSGGISIWKWSLTGIGAICSFGVAAATVCIIILGGRQKNRQHQDNQKLQFHIYADDKSLKQVVHHATKLNEAISAVRGVPLARAHITFGGYYDGL